jgi:uncharacterized protein YidB (DUF937 family)
MGLLDDLLGQLAAGPALSNRQSSPSAPPGMAGVMTALLPVVIAMLGNRGSAPASGFGRASAGGGLGEVLGQVLGGAGGAGGLGALLDQFQRAGFGDQVRSWVGTGANQEMPAGALDQVFGAGGLAEIARRAGLSEADASQGLSQLLPAVVDHVTPNGQVPDGNELLASVEALAKRMGVQ